MDRQHEISFFIFLGQVCIVLCNRNYIVHETPEDNITEKCIIDILSSKTQYSSLFVVINNDAISNDLLRQIHSFNNVKVCVKDYNIFLKVTPDIYLIYLQNRIDIKTFEEQINNLDRHWYRKPEALYIIIAKDASENDLATIFRTLWEHHFIHVLVIVHDINDDASIYTYFPYADGRCGRDYSNIFKLCNCRNARNVDVVEKLREYDKPVLNKCTLNVASQHYPPLVICNPGHEDKLAIGIERFLVELLFERENIYLNYTCLPETEDVGIISENFTVTGMLGKLYRNKIDILFGGYSVNNKRAILFDFICNHLANEDMYIPATSSADLIERWKIVYIMFHTNVWILLLLILFLCAVLLSDFRVFWIVRNTLENTSELFNLLGNATQNITLALRERVFKNFVIIHWLWFMFLINCFYQTGLTSFTTHRTYKPQLDQYLSLDDYNYTPCIPMGIVSFLKYSGKLEIINERYLEKENCQTSTMVLNEVANANNKYTVTMYLQFLWWTTQHGKEKRRIHLMKENLYNNLYALFFKRGFPLLDKLNAKILRLPEHGFVHGIKVFHHIPRELRSDDYRLEYTALKVDDLAVPFGILITGLVFSLLVCIIEVLHNYNRILT